MMIQSFKEDPIGDPNPSLRVESSAVARAGSQQSKSRRLRNRIPDNGRGGNSTTGGVKGEGSSTQHKDRQSSAVRHQEA